MTPNSVILSSNPDVDATTVCPSTNVTFTCFVEQTSVIRWEVGGMEVRTFTPTNLNDIERVFLVDIFLVTLINITNESNGVSDLNSTLEVSSDEVENGTSITCHSFSEMKSISLVIASKYRFVSVLPYKHAVKVV